ncbi:hypothetical protein T02_14050 [Trichinella nativa]|uniref:Uncharacterized protein n=1 Tax=Trichinella nativa TaxID=6335 RepID=A0A0V1LHV7_9BILA|nr:hypothetical protein T02_14050 [Trichinella nativa]
MTEKRLVEKEPTSTTMTLRRRWYHQRKILCYDGPSWNDARLYHGDITEFLELEYRRSTVGGNRGRVRELDLEA